MEKQWYVVHTLTGQENRVRDSLLARRKQEEMDDVLGEVIVPTERVSEVRKGVRSTTTRKFFPGYVLVNIALYDREEDGSAEGKGLKLREKAWYFIRDTPGIIGFLGGEKPVPLPASEVEVILNQVEERREKIKPRVTFEPGETIKITDGPFLNFNGVVEEVDPQRGKLKVSVAIFGRSAPVELEYWQVERVD